MLVFLLGAIYVVDLKPGKVVQVLKLLLFCILLILCWPLALLAVVLYPLIWLLLLPLRLVGVAVGGAFDLIGALFSLPGRVLRAL